ncbi:hypothetical protein E2C01_038808 [Portunus trituberculatus]|uniref:Uncharacterized protein n=1 Tax=Portunus trituberculatus TaxID=210409 RepID=A0A5B7FJ08_PORTR|nr:hypothetical protein [Portunus trituberculatus]
MNAFVTGKKKSSSTRFRDTGTATPVTTTTANKQTNKQPGPVDTNRSPFVKSNTAIYLSSPMTVKRNNTATTTATITCINSITITDNNTNTTNTTNNTTTNNNNNSSTCKSNTATQVMPLTSTRTSRRTKGQYKTFSPDSPLAGCQTRSCTLPSSGSASTLAVMYSHYYIHLERAPPSHFQGGTHF